MHQSDAATAVEPMKDERPIGTDGRGPRWPIVGWALIWTGWIGFLLMMVIGKPF